MIQVTSKENTEYEINSQAGYKKLIVWQKSHLLVKEIYKITSKFPKDELFGLVSQMRRCAVSVPANIVEGYGRNHVKEKLNFYHIARGSLSELEYCIDLTFELEYFGEEKYLNLLVMRAEVGRLLTGFIKSFK